MKKINRLTERDLQRIVKRVIKEDEMQTAIPKPQNKPLPPLVFKRKEVKEFYDEDEDYGSVKKSPTSMGGRGYSINIGSGADGETVFFIKAKKSSLPDLVKELTRFAKNVNKY